MKTSQEAASVNAGLVKWLALAGILGSILFALSGVLEMISPGANSAGNVILNPVTFQVSGLLRALGYIGWLATGWAFYLRGAAGRGWFAKTALAILTLGLLASLFDTVNRIIAVQNFSLPAWQIALIFIGVFVAPVVFGVAALRAKAFSSGMGLVPMAAGVVPFAMWILVDLIQNYELIVTVQGLLWLGWAAMVYGTGKTVAEAPATSRAPA